jgi:hypothetical protein
MNGREAPGIDFLTIFRAHGRIRGLCEICWVGEGDSVNLAKESLFDRNFPQQFEVAENLACA